MDEVAASLLMIDDDRFAFEAFAFPVNDAFRQLLLGDEFALVPFQLLVGDVLAHFEGFQSLHELAIGQ